MELGEVRGNTRKNDFAFMCWVTAQPESSVWPWHGKGTADPAAGINN